ncbi:MAG: DUF4956 domain-containing protein [Bacteroidota bacterium]
MNQELRDFLANYSPPISLTAFLINMALAGVLAWGLGWIYRRYGQSLSSRDSFSQNFVLLAMTTTLIISIVKSSLALSLGLVGALSIVRFRAAIKEPEELVYLFFCIGIGLGLGADQWGATLLAFILIAPVLVVKGWRKSRREPEGLWLSLVWPSETGLEVGQLIQLIEPHVQYLALKRADENAQERQASFMLSLSEAEALTPLQQALRGACPEMQISLVDTHMTPV